MKQPIGSVEWPQAVNLRWFADKSHEQLLENQEHKFKEQLKQNALKIVTRTNKLFQEKIDAWQYIRPNKEQFGPLLRATIRLALSGEHEFGLTTQDRYQLLTFFNYTFNSIEVDFVLEQAKRFMPLSIWINLSKTKRQQELAKLSKRIQVAWRRLEEQDGQLDANLLKDRMFERKFIFTYLKQFLSILQTVISEPATGTEASEATDGGAQAGPVLDQTKASYCQRFIEFMIDLESQLPLRRFLHALLEDTHFIVRCQLSDLARHKSADGQLFSQLVELLSLYSRYDIDIMSGDPLADVDVLRKHEQKILCLQRIFWSKYELFKKFAIKPVKAIDNPAALYKIVTSFDSKEDLFEFLKSIGLVDEDNMSEQDRENAPLMASILMNFYRRYDSQMKKINTIPLFPNESVIWDTNLVPDQYYNYEYPLALPKLNLQFLTLSDYLLRNFMLFKNESCYEIRQDIEDGIMRSKCRWTADGKFATGPKQRMALVLKHFGIVDVDKPKLGEKCPARVRAKVVLNMDYVRPEWKREWEQLRKHDTCFLVSFKSPDDKDELGWPEGTFPAKNGVKFVRGCEIEGLLDSEGKLVDEYAEAPKYSDNLRTFIVWLDCNQYQMDQEMLDDRKIVVYDKFHLIVRRKPEKNNFKGVLETIRSLINTRFVVPDWLRNLLLGFGDPGEANPESLRTRDEPLVLDYYDTFVDFNHLKESFQAIKPDYKIISEEPNQQSLMPPFKVKFDDQRKELTVIPYQIPSRGPYPTVAPKTNALRFTPAQVEAVTSGLQRGLTMVVGPPGTGKTDVAVQILSTLYHSNPEQRTLIVTHSNQALNQIFGKMIELDVQENHLLRMGHGEEDLDSAQDFSRQGRIRHVLKKRLELLRVANNLALSLGLTLGESLTCQSAEYFYSYHIAPLCNRYNETLASAGLKLELIASEFPFTSFFKDAPQPLFAGTSIGQDLDTALGCLRYIRRLFDQLHAIRPFEIFNNAADRSKYLLIREAKIIAMTCTHAGLRRKELVEMNFQYDNILMEETAQILEIETTIPLLLQNPENGVNRLKRWIMIGDHNQLPPIIQNSAFQKFSNMEQSLFARFIRLGVPHIELDAQGRARASLCDLYRWRYKRLRELDLVAKSAEFQTANAGFLHEFQLIDVPDYKGVGETTPMPHYYQNRGEAEFVVATYRYMRIIGYPADKVTILTTYNGQKQLLRDLIEQECTNDAYIGKPSRVTTVDKFQGQQNDYILLSLVRTRTVGHIRDIRRLVVAMSRARLGLYVFGRVSLFSAAIELQPAMRLLLQRPQELCLLLDEQFPSQRKSGGEHNSAPPSSDGATSLRVVQSVDGMQQLVATLYTNYMEEQARSSRLMDIDDDDEEENAEDNEEKEEEQGDEGDGDQRDDVAATLVAGNQARDLGAESDSYL